MQRVPGLDQSNDFKIASRASSTEISSSEEQSKKVGMSSETGSLSVLRLGVGLEGRSLTGRESFDGRHVRNAYHIQRETRTI